MVFGQNPGTNHPRMLGELRRAVYWRRARADLNPLRTRPGDFADPQDALEMLHNGSERIASSTTSCASAAISRWPPV